MQKHSQTIWLCRHGNRLDFVDPDWTGDDSPLSDDGVVQAKETGQRLIGEGIRHIFASPFLRTLETAHHIADALDLRVNIESGASEWLNPEWFAASPVLLGTAALRERFPRVDCTYQSLVVADFPETFEGAIQRVARMARALADACEEDFLVVGHGLTVHGFAQGLLGDDCVVSPGLCALVKIVRQPEGFVLELSGDSSHLTGGEKHLDRFN